jgi:hypothetical protein
LIHAWHDQEISAGIEWAKEIAKHLNHARLILLLISPNFLASKYCYDTEMKRALERHKKGEARVVPIILRPCDWQTTPLKDLQVLPKDAKPVTRWADRDQAFHTIEQEVRRIATKLASSPIWDDSTPSMPTPTPDELARAKAEQEKLAREKAEQERLAREQAERERQAREQAERERQAREQAERERLAREQAERERQVREQVERERLAREQAKRLAKEKSKHQRATPTTFGQRIVQILRDPVWQGVGVLVAVVTVIVPIMLQNMASSGTPTPAPTTVPVVVTSAPTPTPLPPTATLVSPSPTAISPTATSLPTRAPSPTPVPPTHTPIPAIATVAPPTATPVPTQRPSPTPIPPTLTPRVTGQLAIPICNGTCPDLINNQQVRLFDAANGSQLKFIPQASDASLQRDSKRITFRSVAPSTSGRGNGAFVLDFADNSEKQITSGGEDGYPSFVSDERILFFSQRDVTKEYRIYTAKIGGDPNADPQTVGPDQFTVLRDVRWPSVSINELIAYFGCIGGAVETCGLWTTTLAGSPTAKRINNTTDKDAMPVWSPNSRQLAFISTTDGNPEIYVINSDGTGRTRLTNNASQDVAPVWSPDGQWIAFLSERAGNNQWAVYAIRPDGTGERKLFDLKDVIIHDPLNRRMDWSP